MSQVIQPGKGDIFYSKCVVRVARRPMRCYFALRPVRRSFASHPDWQAAAWESPI